MCVRTNRLLWTGGGLRGENPAPEASAESTTSLGRRPRPPASRRSRWGRSEGAKPTAASAMVAPAVLRALRKNKTLRYGVPMLVSGCSPSGAGPPGGAGPPLPGVCAVCRIPVAGACARKGLLEV